ncbi:MAG: 50S ribosomal protein L25 [Anaerolineae bacterium]|jgi:large subunit ribosomal protein L25|nr:50S ribosomal protein L25 [Anaerolineae bacterium]
MEKITLDAELRGVGRHPIRELRDTARVPAVIYGAGVEAKPISVNAKELQKALHQAGSGLLMLQVTGDSPLNVLPREVQRHPVKHNVLHVDFQAVSMTEKLRLHVPIIPVGDAPAMKLNGDLVLVRNLDAVEIECLPADIPNHLVADLTKLQSEDDEVLAGDLAVPNGVKVLTAHDHVIFSLTLSRAGTLEETEEGATTAEPEVVIKGKAAKEGAEEGSEKK